MGNPEILVAGGGPAGSAAAISARQEGSPVRLIERTKTSRHKVCGEFISAGTRELMEVFHLWNEFSSLGPCPLRRCALHLGKHTKRWALPEWSWGLSRFQLDRLLLTKAAALGTVVRRGEAFDSRQESNDDAPLIVACGRKPSTALGERLFGFKAHFEGPSDDAVELFFDACGYVGVSGIEDHQTNVCGIARESVLRKYGFEFDEVVRRSLPLAERLAPLRRRMRWIVVAPLSFSFPAPPNRGDHVYVTGDSLGFIDPFTGSGILGALATGRLAGLAAARGIPSAEYHQACRSLLERPFVISSLLRSLLRHTELYSLARYLPGRLLFRWTRTSIHSVLEATRCLGCH